jgi:acyl carrier protein
MADSSSPSETVPDPDRVINGLREVLTLVLKDEDLAKIDLDAVDYHTRLLSLPIDSLALMETMGEIENRFRVYITEERAQGFVTIGDIIDYVQQRAAAKAARRGS